MFFALIDTAQTRSQRRRRRRDPSQVLLPGSQARGAETLTGAGISDNGLILRWVGGIVDGWSANRKVSGFHGAY